VGRMRRQLGSVLSGLSPVCMGARLRSRAWGYALSGRCLAIYPDRPQVRRALADRGWVYYARARLDQQRAIGGASQLLGVSRRTVPRGSAVRREMDTPAPLPVFSKSTIPAVPREVKRRMKERGWLWVGRLWRQIVFAVD